MPVCLDHLTIPSGNRVAAARLLAELLGVPWAEQGAVGAYSPVYVNDGLTIDFAQSDAPFAKQHCCFRVGQDELDVIVQRMQAAGVAFRSTARGPDDGLAGAAYGGQRIYWNEPDGHVWELLTVSYKREASPQGA